MSKGRMTMLAGVLTAAIAALAAAQEVQTTARVFHIRHSSMSEATMAVLPLLSAAGRVTIEPAGERMTVQDVAEVMTQVAEVLAKLDRSPQHYRIRAELLAGSSQASAAGASVRVADRLRRMFPFTSYRRIGATVVEGEEGNPAGAALGEGHRLSFQASMLRIPRDVPWGMPDTGDRVQLQDLTLVRLDERPGGEQKATEILRTTVSLSPHQEVIIGAGGSEGSTSGLVLILYAESVGGE